MNCELAADLLSAVTAVKVHCIPTMCCSLSETDVKTKSRLLKVVTIPA